METKTVVITTVINDGTSLITLVGIYRVCPDCGEVLDSTHLCFRS